MKEWNGYGEAVEPSSSAEEDDLAEGEPQLVLPRAHVCRPLLSAAECSALTDEMEAHSAAQGWDGGELVVEARLAAFPLAAPAPPPDVPKFPLRVCLCGRSFSGKSEQAWRLADRYALKVLSAEALLSEAIEEAGEDLDYRWYGARTLMSLRLEKGWGAWGLEFRPDFNAVESGMDVFINWNKDFVGKAATEASAQAQQAGDMPWTCAYLVIEPEGDEDGHGGEAVLLNGEVVGSTSSVAAPLSFQPR